MDYKSNSYIEILKSIHPVLILSRVFGIMPLFNKCNVNLLVTRVALIYSGMIFVTLLIHASLMPLYVLHLNTPGQKNMSSIKDTILHMIAIAQGKISVVAETKNTIQTLTMKIINPILLSLMGMCAHWIALMKVPDEFPKIIDTLCKADVFLRTKLSVDYDYVCMKQQKYCFRSVIKFFTIGMLINGYYIFVIWKDWGVSLTFIWCILLALGNITALVMELQFTNLVHLLTVRFQTLNRLINMYIEERNSGGVFHRYHNFLNLNNLKKVMPLPESISNNFLQTDLSIVKINVSLASMMESSRQFHRDLCGLVMSVNKLYQCQLICSLVTCFIRAVLNFYFCIFGYSSATGSPPYTYEFTGFLSLICWTLFYTIRFTNLVLSADNMSQEAKKSKPIAAAINNRFLDSESKDELLLFSNYMESCKVEFTANGLFTLNTHLITSAIGAGTTYLVILIQFQAN